jgi:hypothetical protein
MELGTELSIVLEEYDIFDGDDCVATGSYVIVNGEKLKANGSVLRTILEHLGYEVDISYS